LTPCHLRFTLSVLGEKVNNASITFCRSLNAPTHEFGLFVVAGTHQLALDSRVSAPSLAVKAHTGSFDVVRICIGVATVHTLDTLVVRSPVGGAEMKMRCFRVANGSRMPRALKAIGLDSHTLLHFD
jgi:hypothetical protein